MINLKIFLANGTTCPANQEAVSCVPKCQTRCKNYSGGGVGCAQAKASIAACTAGCICADGYARITASECALISSSQCGGLPTVSPPN